MSTMETDASPLDSSRAPRRATPRTRWSPPALDPEVFRSRFLLRCRGDTLTGQDHAHPDKLLAKHPRLEAGWRTLQELHGMYPADNEAGTLEAHRSVADVVYAGRVCLAFHDTLHGWLMQYRFASTKILWARSTG